MGLPIAVGLLLLANRISLWFFGDGYEKVPFLLQIFTIRILTHGIMNVIGNQYLLPTGREKVCTTVNFIGIAMNILLNYYLIPKYGCIGAAVASVVSESILISLYLVYFINEKKYWSHKLIINSYKYFIAAFIMGIPVYYLNSIFANRFILLFLIILLGMVTYGLCLVVLKDYIIIVYARDYVQKIFRRVINAVKKDN